MPHPPLRMRFSMSRKMPAFSMGRELSVSTRLAFAVEIVELRRPPDDQSRRADEDLVRVGKLRDVGGDAGAHGEVDEGLLRLVEELVRDPGSRRKRHAIARAELDALFRIRLITLAEHAAPFEDEEHLLLRMVEVIRAAGGAGRHGCQAVAEIAGAKRDGQFAARSPVPGLALPPLLGRNVLRVDDVAEAAPWRDSDLVHGLLLSAGCRGIAFLC